MNRIETEAALIRAAEEMVLRSVRLTETSQVVRYNSFLELQTAVNYHKQAIRESHGDLAGCIEQAKAKADERSEGDGNSTK